MGTLTNRHSDATQMRPHSPSSVRAIQDLIED